VIAGAISGGSNADLIKTGTGVLELAGPNTYLGNTLIQNGTLVVTGDLGSQSGNKTGNIVVGKGAVLAGFGTLYPSQDNPLDLKSVVVNPGGTIRGGSPATATSSSHTGTLTVNSNLTLSSAGTDKGTLQFEASRTGSGAADASWIVLGGGYNFNLNSGSSQFIVELVQSSVVTSLTVGETYQTTLATVGSGGHFQLNGSNLAGGTIISHDNYVLQSSLFSFDPAYTLQVIGDDTVGYDLELTYKPMPVPEPATVLGICGGALGLGALVRRRRNLAPS
jgi:autotransporter-associated beta strand protein